MNRKEQEYYDQMKMLDETIIQAIQEEIIKMRKEIFSLYLIGKNSEEISVEEKKRALEFLLAIPSVQLCSKETFKFIDLCIYSAKQCLKEENGK